MFWKRLTAVAAAAMVLIFFPLTAHADYFDGATITGSYSDNVTLTASNSEFYRADNIGPGDETASDITLTNNGQKNVKIRFVNVENKNPGSNDLSPYLILTVTDDTGKIVFNDSMDKVSSVPSPIIDYQDYKPGESHTLHVCITDPIENDNITIGREMHTRWNFEATAGETDDQDDDQGGDQNDDDSTDGKSTGDLPYGYFAIPAIGAGVVLAGAVVYSKKGKRKEN